MDQQQKQDHHRVERQEKQAESREAEQRFSKSGATVRPFWFLVAGVLLTTVALLIWMGAFT